MSKYKYIVIDFQGPVAYASNDLSMDQPISILHSQVVSIMDNAYFFLTSQGYDLHEETQGNRFVVIDTTNMSVTVGPNVQSLGEWISFEQDLGLVASVTDMLKRI